MILATVVLFTGLVKSGMTVGETDFVLRRGIHFNGGRPYVAGDDVRTGYWDVFEAEIDAAAPNLPVATMYALTGNVNRHVLMRFGLDDFQVENTSNPTATLRLTLVDGEKASLKSVRLIKRPWMTPPVNTLAKRVKTPKPGDPIPFVGGVTWSRAGGDVAPWERPGAAGNGDTALLKLDITREKDQLLIKGLGPVVADWAKHPGENFGLLFEFSGETGIWGSTSPEGRPELEVSGFRRVQRTSGNAAIYAVQDSTTEVSVGSAETISKLRVRQGAEWIYEGAPKTFNITNSRSKDARARHLTFVAQVGNQQVTTTIDPQGTWAPIDHAQAAWCKAAIDASVFSFAPFGAMKYINGTAKTYEYSISKAGFYSQDIWEPKTDLSLLGGLIPPPRPIKNPLFDQLARPVVGPLPLSTVDVLKNGQRKVPTAMIARVVNLDGIVMPGVKVTVGLDASGQETELTSDAKGFIFLPAITGTPQFLRFTADKWNIKDEFGVQISYFQDQYARGSVNAMSFDLPFNLPLLQIQRETNLIAGKPVRDSKGSFPAQLLSLVDGKPETSFRLEPGQWVEVDLGRDRLLAEISWDSPSEVPFEVLLYGTGEKETEADSWLKYEPPAEGMGNRSFFPSPVDGRFIRIINQGKKVIVFNDIFTFAGKRS
jgi:hypothetical protein